MRGRGSLCIIPEGKIPYLSLDPPAVVFCPYLPLADVYGKMEGFVGAFRLIAALQVICDISKILFESQISSLTVGLNCYVSLGAGGGFHTSWDVRHFAVEAMDVIVVQSREISAKRRQHIAIHQLANVLISHVHEKIRETVLSYLAGNLQMQTANLNIKAQN